MKEIPIAAVVLLIAFTVAIGGILSIWLIGSTSTITGTGGSQAEVQAKCRSLLEPEVKYKDSETWLYVSVFYKTGTENLYNFTITAIGGGKSNTIVLTDYTKTSPLTPGQVFVKNLTIESGMTPPDKVLITALCLDTPVSAECESGQTCMVPL